MAATKTSIQTDYPLPVYRFKVDYAGTPLKFSEVSGLDMAYDPITYKDGTQVLYMPGQRTAQNVVFKRGIMRSVKEFYIWWEDIKLNLVDKKDVTIQLTNEDNSEIIIQWKVVNCFPKKLSGPAINASSNAVSIEALEVRCDRVSILGADSNPWV